MSSLSPSAACEVHYNYQTPLPLPSPPPFNDITQERTLQEVMISVYTRGQCCVNPNETYRRLKPGDREVSQLKRRRLCFCFPARCEKTIVLLFTLQPRRICPNISVKHRIRLTASADQRSPEVRLTHSTMDTLLGLCCACQLVTCAPVCYNYP